jgi:hypothetical protein
MDLQTGNYGFASSRNELVVAVELVISLVRGAVGTTNKTRPLILRVEIDVDRPGER